ncbi:MAG: DegQ family serine endoprotease [Burkholderiales bacterium]
MISVFSPIRPRIALATAVLILAGNAVAGIPPLTADGKVVSLAPLIEEVTPAVVNIAVLSRAPEQDNPLLQDPFFRRFFGLPEQPRPQISAGSGVIVDAAKGLVLTNHHVIQNAQQVLVTLRDGRQLEAKLLGSDAGTDIALLRIEADDLHALPLGNSDELRVGDYVLAIGNPFGLGQTVTSGIVSALGRTGLNIEGYEDFIQTDASINPGNSGGALVNLKGQLIGINTAIIGPAGGNVGIGFAVPSNMAAAVMRQLIDFGEVRRGYVGLTTQEITPELAKALGVPSGQGAVVVEVAPDSPAAKAGVRAGDVITEVNGQAIRSSADLRNRVGLVPIGEQVELTLLRDGRTVSTRMRIERVRTGATRGAVEIPELGGATLGTVEDRRGDEAGVMVVEVVRDSPAWRRGLRPGDVIVGVNNSKVRNARELVDALQTEGRVALRVVRGDYLYTIVIRQR